MERRPFTIKEPASLKRFARVLLFVAGWCVSMIVIGRTTGGLTTIVLMFASFILFVTLYALSNPGPTTTELLLSPCPKCGRGPMKYDHSVEGDFVFTCEPCQIEWTLGSPVAQAH